MIDLALVLVAAISAVTLLRCAVVLFLRIANA